MREFSHAHWFKMCHKSVSLLLPIAGFEPRSIHCKLFPKNALLWPKYLIQQRNAFFLIFLIIFFFSLHQPRLFKDVKMSESLRFVSMRVNADAFFPEKINWYCTELLVICQNYHNCLFTQSSTNTCHSRSITFSAYFRR